MIKIAAVDTRHSSQQIQNDEPGGAVNFLYLRSHNPQRIRIEKQMKQSNMNEDRRDETPPLPSRDLRIELHTERDKSCLVGTSARKCHQQENENVQSEEDVRVCGTAAPNGLQ